MICAKARTLLKERARIEHGMVKENETMVQILSADEELPKSSAKAKTDKSKAIP